MLRRKFVTYGLIKMCSYVVIPWQQLITQIAIRLACGKDVGYGFSFEQIQAHASNIQLSAATSSSKFFD